MRFKKVFALLLTGIMSVSAPAFVYASSTEEQLADVQAQKEAAQADLAQEQANMASLESKKQELESYLAELNAQYTELTNSVSELGIQAAEKEDELKTLQAQLEEAKATSDKQYEDMKKRIVYMYENGSASMLELLLSSQDLAQFLNRAENIAQISQYDRDMLDKYKKLQADIKAQEEQAEEEAQSINDLLAEKSAKQQEVLVLTANTNDNIQSYIYQISASQDEISALNAQISSADSSIYSLLRRSVRQRKRQQRLLYRQKVLLRKITIVQRITVSLSLLRKITVRQITAIAITVNPTVTTQNPMIPPRCAASPWRRPTLFFR